MIKCIVSALVTSARTYVLERGIHQMVALHLPKLERPRQSWKRF